jgi:hypothetical protein
MRTTKSAILLELNALRLFLLVLGAAIIKLATFFTLKLDIFAHGIKDSFLSD